MEQQKLTPELFLVAGNSDSFVVDDLLDFSNDNGQPDDGLETFPDSSTVSAGNLADSSNSSSSLYTDGSVFSDDLCVPCEDLAELEWLSNFVEESFSKEDQDKLQLLSGSQKPQTTGLTQTYITKPEPEPEPELDQIFIPTDTDDSNIPFPAKARSKRPRSAASTWASRLLALANSDETCPKKKQLKTKEHETAGALEGGEGGERRCLHCATDKTPQWRTGPMGPKTLCNACGVRYKSGRLVPEYRPASSPTFVMTRHSNSHRKVMELRRQKEMRDEHLLSQLRCENLMMDIRSNGGEEFLIGNNNSHVASDFRRLI